MAGGIPDVRMGDSLEPVGVRAANLNDSLPEVPRKILVIAVGGGGDIASAAMLAKAYERAGSRVALASIAWERYVNDPTPGPIRLEEVVNYVASGDGYLLVSGSSYAVRGGRKVEFQAARAAGALGRAIYVVDINGGVVGYSKALKEVVELEGAELVLGVDVGGDSLATGYEENLWSPLADWLGLSALSKLRGLLAVHSPGSDGELDQEYVIGRIDEVARRSGFLGGRFMSVEDAKFLEELLQHVDSEASRVALLAWKGYRGVLSLRRGSRSVRVSLLSTATFFLDSGIAVSLIEPASRLRETRSLEEARRELNSLGIYTELDLEEDLARLGVDPSLLTGDLLARVRSEGRVRVRQRER